MYANHFREKFTDFVRIMRVNKFVRIIRVNKWMRTMWLLKNNAYYKWMRIMVVKFIQLKVHASKISRKIIYINSKLSIFKGMKISFGFMKNSNHPTFFFMMIF